MTLISRHFWGPNFENNGTLPALKLENVIWQNFDGGNREEEMQSYLIFTQK